MNLYCQRCGVLLVECVCGAPTDIARARRERIATAVLGHMLRLVGIAALGDDPAVHGEAGVAMAVAGAVDLADRLIAELDK